MRYAIVLASGMGVRFGEAEKPKQFLMLGDRPIFIWSVEQFLINEMIDRVILCYPNGFEDVVSEVIRKYLGDSNGVYLVEGGATRQDSIMNGCYFIRDTWGMHDDDVIITHDAVRPFVTQRIIRDNVEMLKRYSAVGTACPATDTIMLSTDGETIMDMPVRTESFQAQTPQSFNLKKMISFYESLSDEEKKVLTDGCKIFVLRNEKVALVRGEEFNMKITTRMDLRMANVILKELKKTRQDD